MSMRVAFLADIHGNSPALRAVLDDIQRESCVGVFMLGDIINGLDPHGCVSLLQIWAERQSLPLSCIKGNAEAYWATPDWDAIPRQDIEWNRQVINLIRWFDKHLTETDKKWIGSFPDTLRWHDMYLVHDSPLDRIAVQTQADPDLPPRYREWFYHGQGVTPQTPETIWQELDAHMTAANVSHVFCGHTHEPFCRQLGKRVVCNVGSAGLPLDGDPRPSWVLLETTPSGDKTLSIRRVTYDVSLVHQLIDDTPDYPGFRDIPGFRNAYKKGFSTGRHWREHLDR